LACGTPVIAFDTCGLPDIVCHKTTGRLAKPFDTEDLASGIKWVLDSEERNRDLSVNARSYAESKFSAPIIANQYIDLYRSIPI